MAAPQMLSGATGGDEEAGHAQEQAESFCARVRSAKHPSQLFCTAPGTRGPDALLSRDAETLARFGVAYEEIADSLQEVLCAALAGPQMTTKSMVLRILTLGRFPRREPGFVTPRFRVYVTFWLGLQECPWCESVEYGNFDFEITNRRIHESIRGPGLLIHLIRRHRFFEGIESPYRVDPEKLMRVLEVIPPAK